MLDSLVEYRYARLHAFRHLEQSMMSTTPPIEYASLSLIIVLDVLVLIISDGF